MLSSKRMETWIWAWWISLVENCFILVPQTKSVCALLGQHGVFNPENSLGVTRWECYRTGMCGQDHPHPAMAVSSSPLPSPTHTPSVCDAAADRQWLLSAACVLWPFLRSGMLYGRLSLHTHHRVALEFARSRSSLPSFFFWLSKSILIGLLPFLDSMSRVTDAIWYHNFLERPSVASMPGNLNRFCVQSLLQMSVSIDTWLVHDTGDFLFF